LDEFKTDGEFDLKKWEADITDTFLLPEPLELAWKDPAGHSQFATRIRCHHLIVEPLQGIYQTLYDEGLWQWLSPFGGCYCFRAKRKSSKMLSTHSWGIAVDHLRLGKIRRVWTPTLPGGEDRLAQQCLERVVSIFKEAGWFWGGDFLRYKDPMHLQFCIGY